MSEAVEQMDSLKPIHLREYNGPLYVKNMMRSTISHDDGKGNTLTIGPVYSPESLQILPREIAEHRGFQSLWRAGQVKVSADPDMEEALELADKQVFKRTAESTTPEVEIEEDEQFRDLTEQKCLECEKNVYVQQDTPPLCEVHESLASSYTQYEKPDGEGKVEIVWTKTAFDEN